MNSKAIKEIVEKVELAIYSNSYICIHICYNTNSNIDHALIPEFIEYADGALRLTGGHFELIIRKINHILNNDDGVLMMCDNAIIGMDFL